MDSNPRRSRWKTGVRGAGILLALAFLTPGLMASGSREYEIKAAYLYNFINYIEWTEEGVPAGGTLTIGIVGENRFGDALAPLNGKTVKGRTLAVKTVSALADLKSCQILFISSSEGPRVREILESLKSSHTLTVSEIEGFAESGGVINFISERNKVRFEINPESARSKGLSISSELLKLARVVRS